MADWSSRVENQTRIVLRSHGALFFAPGSTAGLLFMLAIWLIYPAAGMAGVAGALAANAVAKILGAERELLEQGIYGFNGVLAGLGAMAFVIPDPFVVDGIQRTGVPLLLALVSGAGSGAIMRAFVVSGWGDRPGIPLLTLPSVVCIWIMGTCFVQAGWLTLSSEALFPVLADLGWFGWDGVTAAFVNWSDHGLPFLPVAILMVLGYALEAPKRLPVAAIAILLSIAMGGAFFGANAPHFPGYCFFTAAPIAMAIGWFFLTPGILTTVIALASMALAAPVWFYLGMELESLGLPLLTLPFSLVTFCMLLAIRLAPPGLRKHLPTPVPLHRVGTGNAQSFGPSRAAGARYWTGLEELAQTADSRVKDNTVRKALAHISASERVVALTGAGMSTESGIPDYRSGIIDWTIYDPDELSYESFLADEKSRATYWRMSQDFYLLLRDAQPNKGHAALAELERLGKLKGIITQNVDRLHQRAGNTDENVIEIHGNEFGVSCLNCGATYSRDEVYRWVLHGTDVPYCIQCEGGFLKPDSIAFGQPMHFEWSRAALAMADRADCLIVCGTSLSVEPVASLVARTVARGARLIIINFQPTDFDAVADCILRGSTGTTLDRLVTEYRELRDWVDA